MNAVRSLHLHEPGAKGPPLVSSSPTVRAVLDWYEEDASRRIGSRDAEAERRRIWGLFRDMLGNRLVADCRSFELLNFVNGEAGVRSDWTRKRWNGTIQRPFNKAERLGLIVKNTFRGLTFPEGENGRDWSDEEYRALLRASKPLFRRLLVWVRFSGMRPGEARDLEFKDIRVEEDKVLIEHHKSRYITKRPRPIPINEVMGKLLCWCKRNNPPGSKHVLLNSFNRPWTRSAVTKTVAKLRRKIGLSDAVKMHGGRHTFATHALMNGVELPAVMELLGHRQFATTQRYTHLGDKVDHLAESMQQAVTVKPRAVPEAEKAPPQTPLFDGLE